jgi:hypothetical protein
MKHVVMFSGGIGSWAVAKLIAEKYGTDNLYLLFTDVKGNNPSPHVGEDEDTYRFIDDAVKNIGGEYVYINTGKDIWEVFKDRRFLGNSRLASCSHELKQKPARAWLDENCDPAETTVYVGIDWTETHRIPAIVRNYLPYTAEAPLTEPPYLSKQDMIDWAKREGLKPPRAYALGFAHNNCGGGCVRSGQAQFKKLLDLMPERYAEWEQQEDKMRVFLGRDISILNRVVDGHKTPLTLTELRTQTEQQPSLFDDLDFGGCGCFVEFEETSE